jgi:hypothetical protein
MDKQVLMLLVVFEKLRNYSFVTGYYFLFNYKNCSTFRENFCLISILVVGI